MPATPRTAEPVIKPTHSRTYPDSRVRAHLSTVTSYSRAMASTKCSVLPMNAECKATEPPREPAVAGQGRRRNAHRPFLLIERRVAAPVISVHCHNWLQSVRHEKHRRSPTAGLAKEPARVQCSGCGYGRKPGSIQHGRFCPYPAGMRSRPVRQELGVTTSSGLLENQDTGITREFFYNNVVELLETAQRELERDREAAKASLAMASSILQSEIERRSRTKGNRPGALAAWQTARVCAFVDENLHRTIRVEDLSAVAQRSTAHFSRSFKQVFGEPPNTYVVRRRLEGACHLMITSSASL